MGVWYWSGYDTREGKGLPFVWRFRFVSGRGPFEPHGGKQWRSLSFWLGADGDPDLPQPQGPTP